MNACSRSDKFGFQRGDAIAARGECALECGTFRIGARDRVFELVDSLTNVLELVVCVFERRVGCLELVGAVHDGLLEIGRPREHRDQLRLSSIDFGVHAFGSGLRMYPTIEDVVVVLADLVRVRGRELRGWHTGRVRFDVPRGLLGACSSVV